MNIPVCTTPSDPACLERTRTEYQRQVLFKLLEDHSLHQKPTQISPLQWSEDLFCNPQLYSKRQQLGLGPAGLLTLVSVWWQCRSSSGRQQCARCRARCEPFPGRRALRGRSLWSSLLNCSTESVFLFLYRVIQSNRSYNTQPSL